MAWRVLKEKLQSKCDLLYLGMIPNCILCFLRKMVWNGGSKSFGCGEQFQRKWLGSSGPFIVWAEKHHCVCEVSPAGLHTCQNCLSILAAKARKAGGLTAVLVNELDTWSKGTWAEPPHWCRKGKRGRERTKLEVSNLKEFNDTAGYKENDLLQNFFMGNWVDRS